MTTPQPHWAAHPIVVDAIALGRLWCAGHTIAGHSAFAHATRVARTINHYLPPSPELTAAAFLHDSPEYAPAGLDLDTVLARRLSPEVRRIIRALEAEHHALAQGHRPAPPPDPPVLHLSTADKIVSLTTIIRNAAAAPDPAVYWADRQAFLDQLRYLDSFHHQAKGQLPRSMADALGTLVSDIADTARHAAIGK